MIAKSAHRKSAHLEKIETSAALHARSMACHDGAITWLGVMDQACSRLRDSLTMSGSGNVSGTIDGESSIPARCVRFASALDETRRMTTTQHATAMMTPAIT